MWRVGLRTLNLLKSRSSIRGKGITSSLDCVAEDSLKSWARFGSTDLSRVPQPRVLVRREIETHPAAPWRSPDREPGGWSDPAVRLHAPRARSASPSRPTPVCGAGKSSGRAPGTGTASHNETGKKGKQGAVRSCRPCFHYRRTKREYIRSAWRRGYPGLTSDERRSQIWNRLEGR